METERYVAFNKEGKLIGYVCTYEEAEARSKTNPDLTFVKYDNLAYDRKTNSLLIPYLKFEQS